MIATIFTLGALIAIACCWLWIVTVMTKLRKRGP